MHYIGSPAASSGPEFKTIARKEPVTTEEKVQTGKRCNQDSAVRVSTRTADASIGMQKYCSSVTPLASYHPNFTIEKKPKKPKSTVKYSRNFKYFILILTNYVVAI
jgi:hypothetical protein